MTDAIKQTKLCVRSGTVHGCYKFLRHYGIGYLIGSSLPYLYGTRRNYHPLSVSAYIRARFIRIEADRILFAPLGRWESEDFNNTILFTYPFCIFLFFILMTYNINATFIFLAVYPS